ncbi:hypothetical protein ABK040_006401 [Willaertia magna]
MKILLSLLLGLIAATYVSANCSSTWISSNENATFIPNCPVGFGSVYSGGTYVCKQITADMIGKPCSMVGDCKLSWLTCVSNKCEVKHTRFLNEPCSSVDNCGAENHEPLNCVNSECKAYNKVYKGLGEDCNGLDNVNNQRLVCQSGLQCVSGVCREVVKEEVGRTCGIKGNVYNKCASGYCVYDGDISICVKAIAQGQDCKLSYECGENMVCRYASATATKKTCEKKSFLNEYCRDLTDCHLSGYGGSLELVNCNKATNKCQREFSSKVGEPCSVKADCYSGYCVSGKCAQLPQKKVCRDGIGCHSVPDACVCGGKVRTVEDGICAASCQGRAYDVYACAWNAGVTSDITLFAESFFDNKSKVFNLCKNEIQNYYKCLRGSLATAGVTGALDSLPNLEFKGDAPTDENPVMPKYNSASSIVASFASILMIFAAMFAL